METQTAETPSTIEPAATVPDPTSPNEDARRRTTASSQIPATVPSLGNIVADSLMNFPGTFELSENLNDARPASHPGAPAGSQDDKVRPDSSTDMPQSDQASDKKPMRLLDLPIDILKEIIKEVTHTNDLIALTLCHSGLHRLAIPHLYSRFDIVWPDSPVHGEQRSGVDALTYGLATLVMAEEIFSEAPGQKSGPTLQSPCSADGVSRVSDTAIRRRRGNHYAHFTRKFSLGNGPVDWIQEYLISKEGGKMLGTLVALAVARMRSLETFIWDMPTGILRDVWDALSSLGDCEGDTPCRLEKLWVRWHDNSSLDTTSPILPAPPRGQPATSSPAALQSTAAHLGTTGVMSQIHPAALERVVHPTFSIIAPLKSLSVLDIDELAYLDEMAVLIGKSISKLRELRIGIARHAVTRHWSTVWQGSHRQQVDPAYPSLGFLTIGEKRLGGVLGVVTGFVCDMRTYEPSKSNQANRRALRRSAPGLSSPSQVHRPNDLHEISDPPAEDVLELQRANENVDVENLMGDESPMQPLRSVQTELATNASNGHAMVPDATHLVLEDDLSGQMSSPINQELPPTTLNDVPQKGACQTDRTSSGRTSGGLDGILQLDNLELERVPLSVPVLQRAIDWTRLTSLTILHCQHHEQLWKMLKRTFAPRPRSPIYPSPRKPPNSTPRKHVESNGASMCQPEYFLKLTKVHTNAVSASLMTFLQETLAPNTLEVLLLQDARTYSSSISIDVIFKGPLKRHRASLRKVLIDSSERNYDGLAAESTRWKKWVLKREVLSYICSGKMPQLRELGMAIDYRDWHFFLQRLPSIPHLRSLYLPFLVDHVHGSTLDPKELALQIVDIVALRPEVELCYVGLTTKCFEILEDKHASNNDRDDFSRPGSRFADDEDEEAGEPEEDDDDNNAAPSGDDDDDDGDDDDDIDRGHDEDDTESEDDDDDDTGGDVEDDDEEMEAHDGHARLRLREILFYDDKVAIFKARHGRL